MSSIQITSLYGSKTEKISKQNKISLYKTRHPTGKGTIIDLELFDGITLYYMDLQLEKLDYQGIDFHFSKDIITIYYCHQGRFEGQFKNGKMIYLGAGDLALNTPEQMIVENSFPICSFQGFMIIIENNQAKQSLLKIEKLFGKSSINLDIINNSLINNHHIIIYRNQSELLKCCLDLILFLKIKSYLKHV